jgi:hypothetical protein
LFAPLGSAKRGTISSKNNNPDRASLKEMDFAQQSTERAVQTTNWMRAMAEQNLNQSKVAFDGLLTFTRNALRSIDQQSVAICEHSIAVAEQTVSNAFDFGHKMVRVREPQEIAQIQSDFVSRQAQVLGDQTNKLGQKMMQGAHDITKAAEEGTAECRRRSEAA